MPALSAACQKASSEQPICVQVNCARRDSAIQFIQFKTLNFYLLNFHNLLGLPASAL
jgi:hypothetical protein